MKMEDKDLTYKISDDENSVVTLYNAYQFKVSNKGCYRCELLNLCTRISSQKDEDNFFPFPCMSDNRKDKKNGLFLSIDTVNRRFNTLSVIVFIVFVVLAILVYFHVIPNFLEEILC